MPTIQPGSKVLVTGANGYIAVWLVRELLQKGYHVRGTVRSAEKGVFLKESFKEFEGKLEIVVVKDITQEGSFDEAVKGVDAIEHTASPFHFNAVDPQELIEPAVKGTVSILKSALKYGSNVKRIVITSSCAAVLTISPEPRVFTEKNWNQQALDDVEKNGVNAQNISKYRASKALAEKAAWAFVEEHKGSIGWDLTVINPPYIFGPFIHDAPTPSALNTSAADWYNTIVKGTRTTEDSLKGTSCYIDVRDLADVFVLSLEKEEAGGERIIVSAGPYIWQDWLNVANSLSPAPTAHQITKGIPHLPEGHKYLLDYDTTKAAKIFGIKYRSMAELTRDTLIDFERRGW